MMMTVIGRSVGERGTTGRLTLPGTTEREHSFIFLGRSLPGCCCCCSCCCCSCCCCCCCCCCVSPPPPPMFLVVVPTAEQCSFFQHFVMALDLVASCRDSCGLSDYRLECVVNESNRIKNCFRFSANACWLFLLVFVTPRLSNRY